MRFTKEQRVEFERRKLILLEAKKKLKNEFVGIDNIIDEVIELIESWFLFPEGQIRPTVINLFGMTGVGKTSLIKRLFHHIELDDSLYKFDVGDYASQDNNKLSYSFSEQLKNREKQQLGFIFDEFQLGRTIDENGLELDKSGLRAMWDLLDSGKISILQSSYYGTIIYQLTIKLEDCIKNGKVKAKNGKITSGIKYHNKYFKIDDDDDDDKTNKEKQKELMNLFIPNEFYWCIREVWDSRFITNRELTEYINHMDEKESIEFLNDTLNRAFIPIEFDYSNSCIFVIGNIDEAYKMTKNFDPDSDADRFYKNSLKITLPQIKIALRERFRAEQIARLGNSYIIYPSFSSKSYKQLISLELGKTKNKIKEKFNIDIEFDKSINKILYKEGVFPTQGARPVFTTISSIVDSYVGKIVKEIFDSGKNISYINWKFCGGKYKINFYKDYKSKDVLITKTYKVRLKVENLRKSISDEMQAFVAIHEAGHAIASIYSANIIPTEILSRTANVSEGFCSIEFPLIDTKELIIKEIIVLLGGYCAEKIIFGEGNLSNGTYSDFQKATTLSLCMVKSWGMIGTPMLVGHKSSNTNLDINSQCVDEMDLLAEKIIKECEIECNNVINENKYLLLKIGKYLSTHSKMNSKKIKKYINEFGKSIEIKDLENYHSFKKLIKSGIDKIENKNNLKLL